MSDRISNKRKLQQPCLTPPTEKHSAVLNVSELYDPIRQVSLELSDLPEDPTELRRKANLFVLCYDFKQILLNTLYSRACYGANVDFATVATKS